MATDTTKKSWVQKTPGVCDPPLPSPWASLDGDGWIGMDGSSFTRFTRHPRVFDE
jgi:hypothetical protein